ncbi:unnamed protein product [Discosporangium mesarthrocarpum]
MFSPEASIFDPDSTVVYTILAVAVATLVVDVSWYRHSELRAATRATAEFGTITDESVDTRIDRAAQVPLATSNGDDGAPTAVLDDTAINLGAVLVDPASEVQTFSSASDQWTPRSKVVVLGLLIVGSLLSQRSGVPWLGRLLAIAGCGVTALPYLCKCSIYRADPSLKCKLSPEDIQRRPSDMLVWTSLIYAAPCVYGIYTHQYGVAVLQFAVTVGSSLFHLTRETKFFNLDNIFATSLLVTTAWSIYLAARDGIWWYMAVIGTGGPLAVTFIVVCGMPGLICQHPSGHGLCRKSNPDYDFYHMLWHLSSGIGTLVTVHFFELYYPDKEAGGGWFACFPDLPVVPTVSLTIAAAINIYGNTIKLMPLS